VEKWKKVSLYLAGISAWLTGQMGTGSMQGLPTAEPVSPIQDGSIYPMSLS